MLKVAKVVGLNSDQSAAQVLIHHLNFSENSSSAENVLGQSSLFIVAKCSLDDAFTKTRQALAEAEDIYYSSQLQLSQRIEEVLEKIKSSLPEAQDLQVIITSTYQEGLTARVLYLLCEGPDLSALLIREDETVNLCETVAGNKMISGFLKPGDRLVLTTNNLLELLPNRSALNTTSLDILEDEISSSLPHDKINPLAAVILEEENLEPAKPDLTLPTILSQHLSQNTPSSNSPHRRFKFPNLKKLIIPLGGLIGVGLLGWFIYQNRGLFSKSVNPTNTSNNPTISSSPQPKNSNQLSDIPLWLDLSLIKDGFSTSKITNYEDQLLILDQGNKSLVSVSLKTKSYLLLAGQDKLGEAQQVSLNSDSAWVYSKDKGLLRVDTGSGKVLDTISSDKDWGDISAIYGFASNIYILDKANNKIWKYIPASTGFSDKTEYLSANTKADFKDVIGMEIDGSIWLPKSTGEILKYTQGNLDSFSLSGVEPILSSLKAIYLSDETDNIYLLDSLGKRIVVVDKKGNFLYQLLSDKFGAADSLVADEKGKQLYILIGGKIYSTELK